MTTTTTIILGYAGILAFGFLPLISVLLSVGVARLAKVPLDEGSRHPCVVLGVDIGGLLYGMFVAGWAIFATLPLAVLMSLGFTLYLMIF